MSDRDETTGSDPHPDATGLAARIEAGDRQAEEDLVRRFRPGLVTMMRARTGDSHVAPDLAHDTLLAVIAALRRRELRQHDRLAGFVHGVARNILAGHFRRLSDEPRKAPLDDAMTAAAPADADELERLDVVRRAVAALGPIDRQVLEMSLVDGLAPQEIARRIGLAPDAVRMRKMRAVRRAAELVQGWLRKTAGKPLA